MPQLTGSLAAPAEPQVDDILSQTGWACALVVVPERGRPEFRESDSGQAVDWPAVEARDPGLAAVLRRMSGVLEGDAATADDATAATGWLCRVPIPQTAGAYHYLLQLVRPGSSSAHNRFITLGNALKESELDSFRAVVAASGILAPRTDDILSIHSSFVSTYALYWWVHHPAVVECVLSGEYDRIRPVCAEIVPTLNCTNRCTKCSFKFAKQRVFGKDGKSVWEANDFSNAAIHMQDASILFTCIDRLADGGTTALVFTGGGEPLLCEHTIPGMRFAKEKGLDVALYTNGSLLTDDVAQHIGRVAPNLVRVSLNAGTAADHQAFHQYRHQDPGCFSRVLIGIEAMARECVQTPGLRFGIGVLVNRVNAGILAQVALRLREIAGRVGGGIDFVVFRPEFDYFGGAQLSPGFLGQVAQEIDEQVQPILVDTQMQVFNLPLRGETLIGPRPYTECRANYLFAEVGPNGDLFLCCERHLLETYRIGNLVTTSVDDIWQGIRRSRVVARVNEVMKGAHDTRLLPCPPACKPHPLNVVFSQIERLRKEGRLADVKRWIAFLQRLPKPVDRII